MDDAQVWTLMGLFAAFLTAYTVLMLRVVRAEIGRLDEKINGSIGKVEARMDSLDRDVHAVITKMMERGA